MCVFVCVCVSGGGGHLCPFLSICWAILSLRERDFSTFGKFREGFIFAMVLFSLTFADAEFRENKTLAKWRNHFVLYWSR